MPPSSIVRNMVTPSSSHWKSSHSASPDDALLTLGRRATAKYLMILLSIPPDSKPSEAATEKLMQVIYEELAANPKALKLPKGCELTQSEMLELLRTFARTAHATLPLELRNNPRTPSSLEFTTKLDGPTRTLEEQKNIDKAEQLCAELGMPADPCPEASKRHINKTLRDSGEPPFPFNEFIGIEDTSSPTGKSASLKLQGKLYMAQLSQRKPRLYGLLHQMLQVYINKCCAAGTDFV